jgi:signal transduction histidine kinase
MDEALRCPECGLPNPAFTAMSEAVLSIASELAVEPTLQKLVDAARDLVDARYAALGVPDGEGGFAQFLTSGMTQKQYDAIGELPRQHGLLGAMLETPEPYQTDDIQQDPRFEGWPDTHPNMTSFLGVPIVSKSGTIGAFYLTMKRGAPLFPDTDRRLIQHLAAHAAVAIENARLYERSRELSVVEERNRLARELHDSVTQTLFSLSLIAESAAQLADADPAKAKDQIRTVQRLAGDAMQEMRSLIFELRPAELEQDGLVSTLEKHVDVLRRVYRKDIDLVVERECRLPVRVESELFRIVQEAITNALKHSEATRLEVQIDMLDGHARLAVCDFGVGFDVAEARSRSRRLGLTSMEERAQALGGTVEIESEPGSGTTVTVEVRLDGANSRPGR